MTIVVDTRFPLGTEAFQYVMFAMQQAAIVYVVRPGQKLDRRWPKVPRKTTVIQADSIEDAFRTMLNAVHDFLEGLPGFMPRPKKLRNAQLITSLDTDRIATVCEFWGVKLSLVPGGTT